MAAFDDAIFGNSGDFSPDAALDDLIRRQASDLPPDAPMSPDFLVNRLARKLNQPRPVAAPVAPSAEPAPAPAPLAKQTDAPDFSQFGTPVDQAKDYSQFGTPVDQKPVVPPEEPKPALGGILSDVGKLTMSGIYTAGQDVTELLKQLPEAKPRPAPKGLTPEGKAAWERRFDPVRLQAARDEWDKTLKEGKKGWTESLTPETRAARDKMWWDSDKSWFGDAWSDPRAYMSGLVESLPEQALMMGPSMKFAQMAFKGAIASGASREAASVAASRAALLSGSLTEGSLGGAASAREVRDNVNALPPEVLAKSDAFNTLIASGKSPDEARKQLAEDLSTRAFITSGVATGLFGGMGDRAVVKIFTDAASKSVVKRVVGGAVKGGIAEGALEELPQSALQQLAQNEAIRQANPDQALSENVLNQALGGLAIGALQGGGMGAGAGMRRRPKDKGAGTGPASEGGVPPTGPDSGGPSSPEDIAEFLRRAEEQRRREQPESPRGPTEPPRDQQPDPDTMSEAERVAAYAVARDSHDGARDADILKSAGMSDEQIAGLSELDRINAVIRAARPKATAEGAASGTQMAAGTPAALPAPGAVQGTRTTPIKAQTAEDVLKASEVAVEPKSDAQAKAENYQHAHLELAHLGLSGGNSISVETGVGQTRKGVDPDGKPWQVVMEKAAYGRAKGIKGADGQPLDIFIGPNPSSRHVFVIEQHKGKGGGFDENKVMAGFDTPQQAIEAYASSYTDRGSDRIGYVKAMSAEDFEVWWRGGGADKELSRGGATAESIQDNHDIIEQALGADADDVLPADIAHAAEIMDANPGMTPATAFGQAVAEGAVESGFITEEQAEDSYGPEIKTVLEPEREGAHGSSSGVEPERPASDEISPGDTAQAGVVPGGRETGAGAKPQGQADQQSGDTADGGPPTDAGAAGPQAAVKPATGPDAAQDQSTAEAAGGVTVDAKTQSPDKTPTADQDEPQPESVKIEDAGEKIGGARKDKWIGVGIGIDDLSGMTGAELDKHVIKQNIWKRPDYVQAVDSGVNPLAAALIKRVYDRIGNKPNINRTADVAKAQKDYIRALGVVRDALADVKTADDVERVLRGLTRFENRDTLHYRDIHLLYQKGARQTPLYISSTDRRAAARAVEEGFPNIEPWQRLFSIHSRAKGSYITVTGNDGTTGKVWRESGTEFVVYRKNGGNVGTFDTRDDAIAAAKIAYEKIGGGKTKGGEEPNRPHLDRVDRDGPDYRGGRDVTGEDFIADFGFRGVEFGNWVASDERQRVVNLGYDALQDLARAMGLPAKALSLNGTLSVAFGARGKGGRAAAHYEPDRTVINLTKLTGAGTLAHEFGHALDHYLGEINTPNPYGGAVRMFSGGRDTPGNTGSAWSMDDFRRANPQLKPRLRVAVNRLMDTLFNKVEDDETAEKRLTAALESHKRGQQSWIDRAKNIKDRMRQGQSSKGLKQAEDQIRIWGLTIARLELEIEAGTKKKIASDFLANATKLSGATGDYWRRPTEMVARSFEAYVFDKINAEGLTSQYLVQGVEPTRYTTGFKGNPYSVGEERVAINAAWDRVFRAVALGEGKHGIGTRVEDAEGEPEIVATPTFVRKPTPQAKPEQEAEAVDEAMDKASLPDAFANHFNAGEDFPNILSARKFAKEAGHDVDSKAVEEALEYGLVKAARRIASDTSLSEGEKYKALVSLYGRQPKLTTRTSTSVREQAYSTPAPLAFAASRLAGITQDSTVYEPSAGNGVLLIEANPENVIANEINAARAENLKEQGFKVTEQDASNKAQGIMIANTGPVDVVIANPPFGAVRTSNGSQTFDLTDIKPTYETTEIDHAIALRSLAAMRGGGRAVLILGGVAKLASTTTERSNAYNGKSKRLFYKALYDTYNVIDHFTVSGDLYERQGAAWPVDVLVIAGRGKSERALPAADVPRIYETWEELGRVLDERKRAAGGNVRPDQGASGKASGSGPGVEAPGVGGNENAGPGRHPLGPAGLGQPTGVGGKPAGPDILDLGPTGDRPADDGGGSGNGAGVIRPLGAEQQPSGGMTEDEIGDIFDELIGGPKSPSAAPKPTAEAKSKTKPGTATPRPTVDVAQSAAENLIKAADEAMAGLTALFGGGKTIGMGVNFDEKTYAKTKPMFRAAAERFAEFKGDIRELMQRMIDHLKTVYHWTTETLAEAKPYIVRFIKDVQDGLIDLTTPTAPQDKPAAAGSSGSGQEPYIPRSTVAALGTQIPVNMRETTARALERLEARVGGVDAFVATELGYKGEELTRYFGAEQIDAIALGLDALKRNKGFIIGDQTGVGKGRVNAAIIRWAYKNGHIPVFVTEKPNLYADMYRDMRSIGMTDGRFFDGQPRILATNSGLDLNLTDDGMVKIKTAQSKAHDALFDVVDRDEPFTNTFDMVFTTYSQMQTVAGEGTKRRDFLSRIAPKAILILDESHNAGGQNDERKAKGAQMNGAQFVRAFVSKSRGVFYSSATYAKRPDVMDLYSKTDMTMAVEKVEDLAIAISSGGVPMQQAVAAMLTKAGQYIRRERSFDGINYNTPVVPVDRDAYDSITHALNDINQFSILVKESAKTISDRLKGEGDVVGADNATGDTGAESTSFSAIMHNVISQMLLSMKVEAAAREGIAQIKAGRKPVFTVSGTMESFVKDYVETFDIGIGDPIKGDFSDVIARYLERARTITIKRPFETDKKKQKVKHYLTDEELGHIGLAAYNQAKRRIRDLDLGNLPLSPIDKLKSLLAAEGYRAGEVTGRSMVVDYSGKAAVLSARPPQDIKPSGRIATIKRFNTRPENGGDHALILNKAGSTGLSAHASVDFDDKSPRVMFIVQPEANIDTHMQLLGRINRTGQVVLPEYNQLTADIPAEKRPAAVLAKKMASLNANTTASRSSAVTAKDTPDFINEYGDEIARSYLLDNPALNVRLGMPLAINDNGAADKTDAMRKMTGRLMLLTLREQELVYDDLQAEYAALIEQLDAAGENALEAKTLDLRAKTVESTEVVPQRNASGSPFAEPVVAIKASVARLGKPYKPGEILKRVQAALDPEIGDGGRIETDIKTVAEIFANHNEGRTSSLAAELTSKKISEVRKASTDQFRTYAKSILDDIAEPLRLEAERTRLNTLLSRWQEVYDAARIGSRVTLKTINGNLSGIVIGVDQTGSPKNPLALSTWKVTVAIADATRRVSLPFSRLLPDGKSNSDNPLEVEIVPWPYWRETWEETLGRYEHMQSETREDRYLITGNILAGFDWTGGKGNIINYTDAKGVVHQGVLMPRDFDLHKAVIAKGRVLTNAADVVAWLKSNPTESIFSKGEGNLSIRRTSRWADDYTIAVDKSKRTGGVYFLDKKLTGITGDFYSRGGRMVTEVSFSLLKDAVARLQELGARFAVEAEPPKTTKHDDGLANAVSDKYAPIPQEQQDRIEQLLRDIIRHLVGDKVAVEVSDGMIAMPGDALEKWGGMATPGARGMFFPYDRLIHLAMLRNVGGAAFHEAYHAIEYILQTPAERKLMQRETARLRKTVANAHPEFTRHQIDSFADEEIRAIAFEDYGMARAKGQPYAGELHTGIRRWFERLWQALQRLANGLRGLGFQTYEDIFGKAYRGDYARAPGTTPRPESMRDEGLAAAVPPGRAGPRDLDNTIRSLLEDRNLPRLARASKALRFGETNLTALRVALQDRFIRVKHAQDLYGPIPTGQDAYQAESLYYGRTGFRLDRLNEKLDALIDDMNNRDVGLEEINQFLKARHAPERNAEIDRINPAMNGAGSGMTDAAAQAILNQFLGGPRRADFLAIERQVRAIIDQTLDSLLNDGLISQDTHTAWKNKYTYYVPMRGFMEGMDFEDESGRGSGQGFDTRAAESKRALGRKSEAAGPLPYIMLQAQMAIVRGEKNRVGNGWLAFVREHPDPDRWSINTPNLRRAIDANTGLVYWKADFNWYNDPNAFVTKVGGRPQVIRMKGTDGENLATALKNMGAQNMGAFLRFCHLITSAYLAKMSTQYNPNFTLPNLTRDFGEALINASETNLKGIQADLAKGIFPAIKGSFQALSGQTGGEWAEWFREYDKAGGRVHFFGLDNVEDIAAALKSKLRRLEGGFGNDLIRAGEQAMHGFEIINGAVENGTRLAFYVALRKRGVSAPNAAMAARNLTVDFNKRGTLGSGLNALYMFANASIQGTTRMVRALRSKNVRRAALGLVAIGAASAIFSVMAGGDDEAGENHYMRIKPYIRDKNMILMWPKGMGRDGEYIKIPLPYGFSPFFVLGSNMAMTAMGKQKPGKALHAFIKSVADAFNPLGEESVLEFMVIPSALRAGAHINTNKNWTGNPLYPDNDYNKHLPDSEKFFKSNSEFSKWFARSLNTATGGTAYSRGWIDWHPGSIDHVLETVAGGLGKFLLDTGKTAGSAMRGEPFNAATAPIIRRFYGKVADRDADSQTYYERRDEARETGTQPNRAARRDIAQGRNAEQASRWLENNASGTHGEAIFRRADNRMKPLRKEEDMIRRDESLSDDVRRMKIDGLRERMRAIQNHARKEYMEFKGQSQAR